MEAITIDTQTYSCGMEMAWNQTVIQMDSYWKKKRTIKTMFHYIGIEIIGLVTLVYGPHTLQEKMWFL